MLNKLIIALGSIAVGFVCISSINIYDNAVSSEANEKPDYVTEESVFASEQAYINENDTLSAENLPYYQKETTEELVTVFFDSNNIIYELKH